MKTGTSPILDDTREAFPAKMFEAIKAEGGGAFVLMWSDVAIAGKKAAERILTKGRALDRPSMPYAIVPGNDDGAEQDARLFVRGCGLGPKGYELFESTRTSGSPRNEQSL